MTRFGRFEIVRELHRIGFSVVYSAQKASSTEAKFALKILQLSSLILEEDNLETVSHQFLNSARLQQRVSAAGGQHWAPVHDFGSTPDGVFYATDKYDRSLQQLIDGRIKLSSWVLHTIVESIIQGLIELKEACGRPHGNLKTTNVLIVGAGETSQTRIVLSDPLSDEQVDTEGNWDSDLRAIGELIYKLMTHRTFPAIDGWQVPDSETWGTLGKQADNWRNLCNLLLTAADKPGTITLETIVKELEKLRKAEHVLSHCWLIAAGLMVIACIIVLVVFWPRQPKLERWNSLISQYDSWVYDLYNGLDEDVEIGKTRRDRWSEDPDLARILGKIKTASYPNEVMSQYKLSKVKSLKNNRKYGNDRRTESALKAIREICSFFDQNTVDCWTFLTEMTDAKYRYKDRGWQKPAKYLSNLVANVKAEPNKPIVESVDEIIEIRRKEILRNIESSFESVTKYEKNIEKSRDPILVQLDNAYVTEQVADAENVNELSNRLNKWVNLGRKITEFLETNWQTNIDQKAFFDDHGNDSEENLLDFGFEKRLELIQGYLRINPDPCEPLVSLASDVNSYIIQAIEFGLPEANNLDVVLTNLNKEIENIPKPIKKNKQQIEKIKAELEPRLKDLRIRSLDVIDPNKFWERFMETPPIAEDEVNKKWNHLREDLHTQYPPAKLVSALRSPDKEDRKLYSEGRRRVEDCYKSLCTIGQELQTQLPLYIGREVGEKRWKQNIAQVYKQKREDRVIRIVEEIPLMNFVPDVNDGEFEHLRKTQIFEFEQWRADLASIFTDFDVIEDGLELCYFLDDDLPQNENDIRSIWQKWKAYINQDQGIHNALAELSARINRLEQIEQSNDKLELIQIALDKDSYSEAAYAAWMRLGMLSDTSWPFQHEDLKQDRSIRARLQKEFEIINNKDQARGDYLSKVLIHTALKHESEFIKRNHFDNKVLGKLVDFVIETEHDGSLPRCQEVASLTMGIADFVAGDDWQTDKIDKHLFNGSDMPDPNAPVTTETFGQWLKEVKKYKKLPNDPRSQYAWDERISRIDKDITNELSRKPHGAYLVTLENLRDKFNKLEPQIMAMIALPPIEKYDKQIEKCKEYWDGLIDIARELKPDYCKRLDLDPQTGRLVFAEEIGLSVNFLPVMDANGKPVAVSGWEQIRQAIDNQQEEWMDFFDATHDTDFNDISWPKYIRSKKDPSVILRFIPAGNGNPEPFYMAIREITNSQYRLFLGGYGAQKLQSSPPGWSVFVDQSNKYLTYFMLSNSPPNGITWDESMKTFVVAEPNEDKPVVYVTYDGAKRYADWLGGLLPEALQHEYACKANTATLEPWINESEILKFAHVRATPWQIEADKSNNEKVPESVPKPLGAKRNDKDDMEDGKLKIERVVTTTNPPYIDSAWPIVSSTRPNKWDLYDMIGNVWEWCRDKSICGGSCLAPPEYIPGNKSYVPDNYSTNFTYPKQVSANDVGFRVIVLLNESTPR